MESPWRDGRGGHGLLVRLGIPGICLATLALALLLGRRASLQVAGLVLGLLGGIVLLLKPNLSLAALVVVAFVVPLEVGVSASVAINGVILLIPGLVLLWLLRGLLQGAVRPVSSRVFLPQLLFAGLAGLALLWGNAQWDPAIPRVSNLLFVQLGQWGIFVLSFLAFFLAAHQTTRALELATFSFIGLGSVSIALRLVGPGLLPGPVTAVASLTWGSAPLYAMVTAMAASQGLLNRRLAQGWRVLLVGLGVAVPAVAYLRFGQGVAAWSSSVVALAVVLWLYSRRVWVGALLVLVPLVVLAWPFLQGAVNWDSEMQQSGVGRMLLIRPVLDLAFTSPLVGLGLTTHYHYLRFVWIKLPSGALYTAPRVNSHNVYVDIFAQMGIIGLGLLLWIVAEVVMLAWRLRDRFAWDFRKGYVVGALAAWIAVLYVSMLADLLLPFVYNVGFRGFRMTAFAWLFAGGLVSLASTIGGEEPGAE